ncbi:DUF445 domain-containing protein [Acetobacter nitrogenifigens]|uniref:Membrane protein n=1 Tax=Acetobacter nitrogenifigens DSM 23921 = NBRC 105050 TaxID=1120919 RepID=A0A511X609_9PROT|nr:DUF445 domain-containing protein [Acetobacter nitrogenifigens]GEN58381.1 membrane protein [Acetobacter nitrogenifigens DSM 23921 = NBRC 105050]
MNAQTSPDDDARRALIRQKRMATGMLGGMAVVTLAGYILPARGWLSESLWIDTLRAGGRAGIVGGLADWFAVTALFRQPLGLPIPHTAIIPAQKERLGRALGRFVTTQVLTEAEVDRVLLNADLPGIVARLLADPTTAESLTRGAIGMVPNALERLEDGRAGAALGRSLPVLLGGANLAPVIARALRALVESEHHQEVLSFLVGQLKSMLQSKEAALRVTIEDRVREQGGRLLSWAIGGSIATKVLVAAAEELDRINPRDSALREGFTAWVRAEIDRIENDPERADELSRSLRDVFHHDSMVTWGGDLWARLRRMIIEDTERNDGWIATIVRETLARLAVQAEQDPLMRRRIEDSVRKTVWRALPTLRDRLGDFIAGVVGNWDAAAIADRLELRVGQDLQYIRMNGTLVGFGVGAVLSLGLRMVFGVVGQ